MADLGSVQNVLDDAYVSSVDFLHDRDIYDMLFDRYDEFSMVDFFDQTGRKKPATQTEFHHFEKDYVYQNILIDAVAGSDAIGEDVTITLDASNHDNGKSYPKVGDTVMFSNKLTGLIISKDTTDPVAHDIVIRPIDTVLDNIVDAATVGELLPCYGNAFAEGGEQPEGLTQKPLRFSGIHQIFKNHFESTGTEATNKVEIELAGGKRYWMYEGEHNAFNKHKMDISFSFLFNKQSDGLTDVAGEEVRVTKGLAQWIREEGNIKTGGVSALSDFDTIIKTLDKRRGSKENLFLSGINLDIDIDNVLIDKLLSGAIQYNTFGTNNDAAKNKAVDLGFNSIRKGSWTFHLKQLSEFNHENVTGATDQTWPDTGFIIPTDKGQDAKSGETLDSICMRYKNAPGYDREYFHTTSGMWAKNPTSTKDVIGFEYLSEQGLQCFGLNRFMILEG